MDDQPQPLPPPRVEQPAAVPLSSTASSNSVDLGSRAKNAHVIAIVGAGLLILGSFLDWVSARTPLGSYNMSGIHGDGVITAICGAGAILSLTLSKRAWPAIAGALVGVLTALNDASNMNSLLKKNADKYSDIGFNANVGIGLYVCILGSVACLVGVLIRERS